MSERMYKVCIFDLDGTLTDTVESMAYTANLVLKELGFQPHPSERYKYYAGDGAKELCRRCLIDAGDTTCSRFEEMYETYLKYFKEYCLYQVKPYDGIVELLHFLKDNGKKITVLSNKPHEQAIDVVEKIFGTGMFDYIQGQKEGIPRKPDPTGALHIARHFGVSSQECLYIGDTSTDMKTGKAAAMFSVGVLWGFRTREELEENHADLIVSEPAEIRNYMEKMEENKQIKLIASDVDGTLLIEGSDDLNPEFYEVVRKLKEKDILFAAASGRQYGSLKTLFAPILRDMIFIADNGANIICRGYEMHAAVMERSLVEKLIPQIRQLKDCYLVVSSRQGETYMEHFDDELYELLVNGYHNTVHQVEDILAEPIDIIKCSIYKKHGIEELVPTFMEMYQDKLHVTIAGDIWLDFMNPEADKGNALKMIQKSLHISREETMAFGDNMNDIGMIRAAGESYAVSNAVEQVRKEAKHIAGRNVEDGVLNVLKTLL